MGQSGNPAKRAAQEHDEPAAVEPTPVDADGVEDFDAFWSSRERKRNAIRIQGEVVELPAALPMQFELEARRHAASTDETVVRRLVSLLFGADLVDKWAEGGMDAEQFRVLLAYVPARLSGADLTMAQVADQLAAAAGEA